ncbi:MAG TPA: response regulator [Myxococcota bacterium]|nr:response regulator [Myxococcota bacterium]
MVAEVERPSLLLVDDDEIFRTRAARAFEERGFEVRSAGSAEEAIELARAEPPEYATVDLRMPGAGGLTLVDELLALDPHTRVVVLTGYGSVATAVEAMRRGAVHYLQKPVDADAVAAALRGEDVAAGQEAELPSLARQEWEYIQRVLDEVDGNVSEAARRLRIHRRSLQRKLQRRPPRR